MSDLSRKHVLIVDDTETNLDVLVDTLGSHYTVRVATDGRQALEEVGRKMPDLLLLDILMPKMDGYEVCTRLKDNPKTRDIPVIFITSLTESPDEARGLELGAVDYITKPFSTAVVKARVKTHLELAGARKKLKRQNEVLRENLELREQVEQVTRHDLKNPLQVLLASAQMFASDMPFEREEIRDLAKSQVSACDTILNMINRSLDLYKLENGTYPLKREKTDILPLVDRILAGNERIIRNRSLEAIILINGSFRRPKDHFHISCDSLLFYSMMSNLITNALEASPNEDKIRISLENTGGITISVENKGAVPETIRNRFFDKFVTAKKINGTGLGTYSARLTATIHNSRIRLHTSDATDTTRVTLTWSNQ